MSDQSVVIDPATLRAYLENSFYRQLGEAGVKKAKSDAEAADAIAQQEKFKSAIWGVEFEERRIKLEATKDALQRAKIRQEERDDRTVFLATWSGLVAEGDTPEMACSNFDRMWVGGDEEL